MSFSLESTCGWSCPIRVDKTFLRKSVCVFGKEEPLALVLTAHHSKGQTYVAIHKDDRPQMLLENRTGAILFCAQSVEKNEVASETQHFRWNCKLPTMATVFYTMPLLKDKFPELPQNNYAEKIALATDPESKLVNYICIKQYHSNATFLCSITSENNG